MKKQYPTNVKIIPVYGSKRTAQRNLLIIFLIFSAILWLLKMDLTGYFFFSLFWLYVSNSILKYAYSGEYIRELIVSDDNLAIVYCNVNDKSLNKDIPLKEIKNVNVVLNVEYEVFYQKGNEYYRTCCDTQVTIETEKETVNFDVKSHGSDVNYSCHLIKGLIDVSNKLPNFKYEINDEYWLVKQDIQHYAIYGKGLPWTKKMQLARKLLPHKSRLSFIILFFLFILFFITSYFVVFR